MRPPKPLNQGFHRFPLLIAVLMVITSCGTDSSIQVNRQGGGDIVVPPPVAQPDAVPDRRPDPALTPTGPRVNGNQPIPEVEPLPGIDVPSRKPRSPLTVNRSSAGAKATLEVTGFTPNGIVFESYDLGSEDWNDCALIKQAGMKRLIEVNFLRAEGEAKDTRPGFTVHVYEDRDKASFTGFGKTLIFNSLTNERTFAYNQISVTSPGKKAAELNNGAILRNAVGSLEDKVMESQCKLTITPKDAGTPDGWLEGTVNCTSLKNSRNEWKHAEIKFSCPLRTSRNYPWDIREVIPGIVF